MNHQQHHSPSKEMMACMKACSECSLTCTRCSHHCLGMGGEHASQGHQGIMRDCVEICMLAASFMGRASAHAAHVCKECAEICGRCAESCERLAEGDKMMTECAQACRKCAESCEQMAAAHV